MGDTGDLLATSCNIQQRNTKNLSPLHPVRTCPDRRAAKNITGVQGLMHRAAQRSARQDARMPWIAMACHTSCHLFQICGCGCDADVMRMLYVISVDCESLCGGPSYGAQCHTMHHLLHRSYVDILKTLIFAARAGPASQPSTISLLLLCQHIEISCLSRKRKATICRS